MEKIYTVQLGDWLGKKFRIIHNESQETLCDYISTSAKTNISKAACLYETLLKRKDEVQVEITFHWLLQDEPNPIPRFIFRYELEANSGFLNKLAFGLFSVKPFLTEDGIMRKSMEYPAESENSKHYIDMPFGRVYY